MAQPSLPRCPSFTMFLVVVSSLPLAWSSEGRGVPGPLAPQETSVVPYQGSGQRLCVEGGICGESASLPAARPPGAEVGLPVCESQHHPLPVGDLGWVRRPQFPPCPSNGHLIIFTRQGCCGK